MKRPLMLAMLLFPLLLTGCLLGGKAGSLTLLAPQVSLPVRADVAPVDWVIQIQRPVTDAVRDSDRLMVRRESSRLQVYPAVAWIDSVPELFQSLMVRSFSDTGQFAGVVRAGGVRSRFALASDLRHFEVVDQGNGVFVEVAVHASLINLRTARPVASQLFRVEVSLASTDIDAVTVGFEQALTQVLAEMAEWSRSMGEAASG